MTYDHHPIEAQIAQRVKANALSAAFGAACLIYFGFSRYQLRILYVRDPFSAGEALSSYVFRIGGVLLLMVALWSWIGKLPALMADAVVSMSIGVLLIASALLMMVGGGGGLNILLFVVFGVMFISAGLRNGRDFMSLRKLCRDAGDVPHQPHIPQSIVPPVTPTAPIEQASPIESTTGSLASELRRRKSVPTDQPADDPYANEEPTADGFATDEITEDELTTSEIVDDVQSDATPLEDSPPEAVQSDEPPPDGFLSSFADEDTPRGV